MHFSISRESGKVVKHTKLTKVEECILFFISAKFLFLFSMHAFPNYLNHKTARGPGLQMGQQP